jgi:DNA repair protein Crb2 Tudor domain
MRIIPILAALAALTPLPAAAQAVGDWVLAPWQDSTQYFPGVVVASSGLQVTIRFDDGTTENRLASDVRLFDWRTGSKVACLWTDGSWYNATITWMGDDGLSMQVRYDEDGVMQRTQTGRCRTRD